MSKIPIQTEIDLKTFINGAVKLNLTDLEACVNALNSIIIQKKSESKSFQEAKLLRLHSETILNKNKQKRLKELSQKVEAETITSKEQKELLKLGKENEQLRNKRVKLLIELAQLRNIPFTQLMSELELIPVGNA